jgi:phenylacetate-coenzyme A ligase PaaK-like adenylate-forming protein
MSGKDSIRIIPIINSPSRFPRKGGFRCSSPHASRSSTSLALSRPWSSQSTANGFNFIEAAKGTPGRLVMEEEAIKMLDTAWRQLRYGLAMATGREIRVSDVRGLVDDLLATRREFGSVAQDQLREMLGLSLDAETRHDMDARRWRIAVRNAYEHTSYYRDALESLGLDPGSLTLDRRDELPPTPKEALRSTPEAFVSSGANPVLQAWTTGTTGIPTSFWFSRYELELSASLAAVSLIMSAGFGPEDVLQICVSSRAVLGLHNTLEACRMIGAACFVTGIIDPGETLARLTSPLHLPGKKPMVSAISINPSYLGMLIQEAQRLEYGPGDFGLERIICGGEILTDALRRRAEATFGAPVTDNYAMTETFPLAGLVCTEGHLHVAADQGLVEVLHPRTFAPTAPGDTGTLVITPFPPYRETMPVLRLATGDMVRRLDHTPSCELAGLPATSPLLGRATLCQGLEDRPLYQREILDLLETEIEIPLPCRYAVGPAVDGIELNVLVQQQNTELKSRLEVRAAERRLPITDVALHTDPATMPRPEFARALLRETVVVRDERSGSWSLR